MPGKHNFRKMMGYAGGGTPGMDDIMETEEYKKVMKKIGGKNKADRTGESITSGSLAKGKFEKIRGDGQEVQDYNDASTRFKASAMKADEVVNTKRDLGGGPKMTLSDKKVKPKTKDSDIESGVKTSPKKAKDNLNARVKARGQGKVNSRFSDDVRGMSAKELKGSGFKQYQNKPYERITAKMGMKSGGKPKAYGMKHGGQACRGGGKATRGTKFTMR